MKTIEINLSAMFQEDEDRLDRAAQLTGLTQPTTETQKLAIKLLADIITDAPRYGKLYRHNGVGLMDSIVTTPATMLVEHIQKLEAQVAELMAQVNA